MSQNRNRNNRRRNHSVPIVQDVVPASGHPQITGPIGIPYPPDSIFKFRKNRHAPAQDIWGGSGAVSYAPKSADYIEGEGNFVNWWGVPFPSKCVAPDGAIYAVNPIKRDLVNSLKLLSAKAFRLPLFTLFFVGKKKRGELLTLACQLFNSKADTTLTPFYLEDGYYCALSKEIRTFVKVFLSEFGCDPIVADKTGEIIGCLFEYDNAYRWRTQDLITESNTDDLLYNLPGELERLLKIESSRERIAFNDMTDKFNAGVIVLKYAWYIPSFKKIIQKSLKAMDVEAMKLDESDIYHTCLYGDYDMQGKSLEERVKILEGYHGQDQSKWPPRIVVKSN